MTQNEKNGQNEPKTYIIDFFDNNRAGRCPIYVFAKTSEKFKVLKSFDFIHFLPRKAFEFGSDL